MKNKKTPLKSLIFGIPVCAAIALLVKFDFFPGLDSKPDIDKLSVPNSVVGLTDRVPVSKEMHALLLNAAEGRGYGNILGIYDTRIDNIKEIDSPSGTFYITEDGEYVFFGDLVNLQSGISETYLSNRYYDAKLLVSDAMGRKFVRGDNKKMQKYVMAEHLDSNAFTAPIQTPSDLKSVSPDTEPLLNSELESLSKQIINKGDGSLKSIYPKDDSTLEINEKMSEFKNKWREKIEAKMSKSFDKVDGHSQTANSNSHQGKSIKKNEKIDMSKLQSKGPFVSYKGNKKSKIGYSTSGKKLTEDETQAQIIEMYERLDKIGEKWSVVYPAEGEQKMGVMVFSDPTCPYCQKLHKSIPKLNKAGVKVTILMYPRALALKESRPERANKVMEALNSVWCSADPASAMTELYEGNSIASHTDCSIAKEQGRVDFPAAYQYFLGKLFSLKGTPLSFTSKGEIVRGFRNSNSYLNDIGLEKEDRNKGDSEIVAPGL